MRKFLASSFAIIATATAPHFANAQELTVESLQGAVINTTVTYAGTFRRQTGSGPGKITNTSRVSVLADGAIDAEFVRTVIAETPVGNKQGTYKRALSGKIGVPAKQGSENAVWLLNGNDLVFLRAMEVGGSQMTITFTRDGPNMKCKVEAPFAQEVGAGASKMGSAFGGKVEILNVKQTSAKCVVTRKEKAAN